MGMRRIPNVRAGLLNQLIVIQAGTETVSSSGAAKVDWSNTRVVATCYAMIEPVYGLERDTAAKETAEMQYTVTIRFRHGITPAMRVYEGSPARTLDIISVTEAPDQRHKKLELLCRENLNG